MDYFNVRNNRKKVEDLWWHSGTVADRRIRSAARGVFPRFHWSSRWALAMAATCSLPPLDHSARKRDPRVRISSSSRSRPPSHLLCPKIEHRPLRFPCSSPFIVYNGARWCCLWEGSFDPWLRVVAVVLFARLRVPFQVSLRAQK